MKPALMTLLAAMAIGGVGAGPAAALMKWPDLLSRPKPGSGRRIAYGSLPQQFGELWTPETRGAPLVVMIHGGCWTKAVANLSIMDYAAEDLRRRGVAVWNIEYRGVDEPGGGYPGTYQDVGAAVDAARDIARREGLDFSRPIFIGHSAGGHLALWAAARRKLPAASPLAVPDPVRPTGVVDLAGLVDLERNLDTACGSDAVMAMRGRTSAVGPYADTSPAALSPLGVRQFVLHGAQDVTVRPEIGAAYAAHASALGDVVSVLTPPGGHVEEIAPGTPAWDAAVQAILSLVGH